MAAFQTHNGLNALVGRLQVKMSIFPNILTGFFDLISGNKSNLFKRSVIKMINYSSYRDATLIFGTGKSTNSRNE